MHVATGYRTIHVEGRTPGPRGRAGIVTLQDGQATDAGVEGSHHEAAYLAAIVALAEALQNGEHGLHVTSPSDHLVEQMNGGWQVGEELEKFHDLLVHMAGLFPGKVTWDKAPRSDL